MVGDGADDKAVRDTTVIYRNLSAFKGDKAVILYNDSSTAKATFVDYEEESVESYYDRYKAYQTDNSRNLSAFQIGDSAVISGDIVFDGKVETISSKGHFEGYHPDGVLLDDRKFFIHSTSFDVFNTMSQTKHSGSLPTWKLSAMIEANAIPIRGIFRFQDSEHKFKLTNTDFKNVMILPYKTYYRWLGAMIGLVADIVLLPIIAPLLEGHKQKCTSWIEFFCD